MFWSVYSVRITALALTLLDKYLNTKGKDCCVLRTINLLLAKNGGSKAGNDEGYYELQEEIERLEGSIPEVPKIPQLWTSDITPEYLGTIMAENNKSMAIMSDEGGIFDILAGLYSGGKANIDLFLQG